jgi:D-glycero-D-manno-heptose 1,7-bisphosphate phosphatase
VNTNRQESRPDQASSGNVAKRRAVFLDRDGVINRAIVRDGMPFPPMNLKEFELLPRVDEACELLKASGFCLVIVTNQPDVGHGKLAQKSVEEIHRKICQLLPIDHVEVCYDRNDSSEYRKPNPGMLRRAAMTLDLDLGASFMVGDRWRDVDCGYAAGCRTIFIDYGYAESLRQPPDFRARDLLEAARIIVDVARQPWSE